MFSLTQSVNKKQKYLVSQYIQIPENINSFNFDTLHIEESFILRNIAGYIFKQYLSTTTLNINEEMLANFIEIVCENYKQNHFHNFQHAVNVLHMTYFLLQKSGAIDKFNSIVIFGMLIAAISHDVDHPGNTNSYEINSLSKYALLYNDKSVLENHHCSLTFELLAKCELLNSFKGEYLKEFRKTIITCILGTDMSEHYKMINKYKSIDVNAYDNNKFLIYNQYLIASLFVHCADLSNSVKDFDVSFEWSKRIWLEFYDQSLKEQREGLPILPFVHVSDSMPMCKDEIFFIACIAFPMWELLKTNFSQLDFLEKRCNLTLELWRNIKYKISDKDFKLQNMNY